MERTIMVDFEYLMKYLKDSGVTVIIDRNPSPEKIAYIKEQIKKKRSLIK